jgi:hypothetical protein
LHWDGLPRRWERVQRKPSLQKLGQFPSHVSGGSIVPLPHVAEQSLSFVEVQPSAQQPSLPTQAEIVVYVQRTLHVSGDPVNESRVQGSLSSHDVGQFPSQVSPVSTFPLPHVAAQSSSLPALQFEGQHPS